MVKATADSINYDIDIDVVRKLITELCAMAKVVNAPKVAAEQADTTA